MSGRQRAFAAGTMLIIAAVAVGETTPSPGGADPRIRTALYAPDEVFRVRGHVGYQIDLQFEPGERFMGLGSGDIDALSFVAEENHLFIKPKVAHVATNLTILTSRRSYQVDYATGTEEVIYALRFTYPLASQPGAVAHAPAVAAMAESVTDTRNADYWFCGHAALRPDAAWDDGVHTYLRFGSRAELPALFVRNEDGSESLLNFSIGDGVVEIHRVARELVLRRGRLAGCIVNRSYRGSGERLPNGAVARDVVRAVREPAP